MRFTKLCDTLHPADEEACTFLIQAPEGCELEFKAITKQRTSKQNNAIHRWCREQAEWFMAHGVDYFAFPWKSGIELPFDEHKVKHDIWLRVQNSMFGKKHTSDLTTEEVGQVYSVVCHKLTSHGYEVPPLGRE